MYYISLTLRLFEDVYKGIKKLAVEDNRSINAEINYILKKYIEERSK